MEYKIGYKLKNQPYKLMGNAERELLMLNGMTNNVLHISIK